jgi:6-phosphogluconolactonase
MPPTLIVDDRAGLVKAFVERIEEAGAAAVSARGRFAIAVTAGRDAEVLLPALVDGRMDWSRTDVFWGDERAVAPTHPDSNYGAIKRVWLDRSTIDPARVHPMRANAPDLDAAARDYEAALVATLGASPVLDACILGMGPDGHVCSLFPGHPLVAEQRRLAAAIYDSPKPPARRLTLTLPMLTRARLAIVLALSTEKRPVLDAVLAGNAPDLPVARVLREAPAAIVLAGAP